jgi:hypothetical protein
LPLVQQMQRQTQDHRSMAAEQFGEGISVVVLNEGAQQISVAGLPAMLVSQ